MRFGIAYDTVHFTIRVLILYHLGRCTFNTLFLFLLFIWLYKCTVKRWVSPRYNTVDPMLIPSGNPFKCHEVLNLQPVIPPKRFDSFPPLIRRSRRVQIFLEKIVVV